MLDIMSFKPHAFFLFLLPPIMFEAGFNLNVKPMLKSIFSVLAVTILATLLASFIFSGVFWYGTSYTDIPFSIVQSL